MKKLYTLILIIATAMQVSCSDDNKMSIVTPADESENAALAPAHTFPKDDGSTELNGINGKKAYDLLVKAGPSVGNTISYIEIASNEYIEIAQYTSNLVKDCKTAEEKYLKIFNWLTSNIKYTYGVSNNAYPVFKSKKGICQGYANLLKVMLHTQNIPCVNVNGTIPEGGHAWNYVYYNDKWYCSDPTNGIRYAADEYAKRSNFSPTMFEVTLFEDEYCTYGFYEGHLNVNSIKSGNSSVVIPYSAGGFKVTMLNPRTGSGDVTELYIGTNITTLGENVIGLESGTPMLENIYVDPENSSLESFSNVVYTKNKNNYSIIVAAPATKFIELKPIPSFDKESKIKNLKYLETITFVPGTEKIGDWTVENCPMLHTAYIAPETIVNKNAFKGTAANFQIIRGNFTNIPQIKM